MRLAALTLGVLAAAVLPAGAAFAQEEVVQETPEGAFSSPARAVAGQPIYLRSITPCPRIPGAYQFVRAGVVEHSRPDRTEYVESTDADLRTDGSWELTLSAPVDMPNGITRSYDVHVQCLVNPYPYRARDAGADEGGEEGASDSEDPAESVLRYFLRPLRVTGFGPSDVAEGDGPSGTTSTTASTTSTTAVAPTTVTVGPSKSTASRQTSSPVAVTLATATVDDAEDASIDDSTQRIAAARAELAAAGVDVSTLTDGEVLASTSRSPVPPPPDGALPWWAFACATALAVGAIVAFGARRTSALAALEPAPELDREPSGD